MAPQCGLNEVHAKYETGSQLGLCIRQIYTRRCDVVTIPLFKDCLPAE